MRISGHAYPWDVIGDPGFVDRVAAVGADSVTLAAAYHSARAATPWHPARQVVDARHAALYRPVRERVWAGRRLRPAEPDWMPERDSYAEAAQTLWDNDIAVSPWIVLTHGTRLGVSAPDLAVVNCFGEHYPYALCPGHAEVRDYAATLTAEVLRDLPVHEVSIEACGQLGVAHLSHHDKTAGAWTPAALRWLSVCCCVACRSAWRRRGLDDEAVVSGLREAVRGETLESPRPLSNEVRAEILAARHEAVDALRTEVVATVRQAAPGAPIVLHANPDPWATGASPGLTPSAAAEVDALLLPCWPTSPDAEPFPVGTPGGLPLDAYITVLPPADLDELPAHISRLLAAGVRGLNLYHLGLAPPARLRVFTEILAALRTDD